LSSRCALPDGVTDEDLITVCISVSGLSPEKFLDKAKTTWGWTGKWLCVLRQVVRKLNKDACGCSKHRLKKRISAITRIVERLGLLSLIMISINLFETVCHHPKTFNATEATTKFGAVGSTRFDL
jgi:hypothetical protein